MYYSSAVNWWLDCSVVRLTDIPHSNYLTINYLILFLLDRESTAFWGSLNGLQFFHKMYRATHNLNALCILFESRLIQHMSFKQ